MMVACFRLSNAAEDGDRLPKLGAKLCVPRRIEQKLGQS
jgi:hypothetical protein